MNNLMRRLLQMKGGLLIAGLLMSFNYGLMAQDIALSKIELEHVLCQRWEIEYAKMGGMKITQKIGAADFDLKFLSGGEYQLLRDGENDDIGKWVYDLDKGYVVLSIQGKVTSKVTSLTENKLILMLVADENAPAGLISLEVHFKPH